MATDYEETRLKARSLYWRGYSAAEVARTLGVPYGTVDAWKRRDKWDETPVVVRIETQIELRLQQLICKEDKSDRDLNEIDHLSRVLERTTRIHKYEASGKEADLNPAIDNRAEGRKKKQAETKNALTEEQVEQLVEAFEKDLFAYQVRWHSAKTYRVRNILKSRQIGATWYFARESFVDAITTGDNQIFLSASKAQAHVFREYIVQWVKEVTGVVLKGTPITLWNGATLYFLGTNSKTAQSYHGHVYMDEYGWIPKFLEFRKVASGMATHKKWRLTYFSTPSTKGSDAYAFWSGEAYNKGRAKEDRAQFNVDHAALVNGAVGPDDQWRQIVTILDAARGGCDLFDIEALRREYNDQDFANLFMAEWVDDSESFFTFAEMRRCMVDSWDEWLDFQPMAARPFGDKPVWLGVDPSQGGDNAAIVVVAPPQERSNSKLFRVLEKLFVNNTDFDAQVSAIRGLLERYNVVDIGIDSSTLGQGVYQLVRSFFPAVREIVYSVDVKTRLVMKAKQLTAKGQLAFDAGWSDVALAFMSIKRVGTGSGRQITFAASRSKETGHADVAWAVMNALDKIQFTEFDQSPDKPRGGFVEIF